MNIIPIITPTINIIHIKWGLNLQSFEYVLIIFFVYQISNALIKAKVKPNNKGYITKLIKNTFLYSLYD